MQYDLEKEKRWMKVLRQDQSAGRPESGPVAEGGEKSR